MLLVTYCSQTDDIRVELLFEEELPAMTKHYENLGYEFLQAIPSGRTGAI